MRAGRASRGFTLVELLMVISILSVLMGVGLGVVGQIRPGAKAAPGVLRARMGAARGAARSLGAPAWVRLYPGSGADEGILYLELATMASVASFSFEDGARGAFGMTGLLEGGAVVPEGRFGNGLVHATPGVPGMALETENLDYLSLETGFMVRVDVRPTERRAMILVRWGSTFSLGLDESGRPQASMTLQGRAGLPGEKRELLGGRPVPLGRWTTLELTHDGTRAHLRAGGRLFAEADAAGRPFYKRDVPFVVSDAQYPVAGVLDEVRLFTIEFQPPEALPQGVQLLEGPEKVRFAPGGELDPEYHTGPVRWKLSLPGDHVTQLEVTLLGVVQ